MKFLRFAKYLLNWVVYCFSFLAPRSKRVWIFTGWHKNEEREIFADNSKYLFLHVTQHHKNITPVWIARDGNIISILRKEGYKAHTISSLRGIYYSLRAKYTVIDANMPLRNWRYSGGSQTIQLWHAEGIKKLNFTYKWSLANASKIFYNPGLFKKFKFLICSSPYIRDKFICPSFDVSSDEVRITGLPRYDVFFKNVINADIDEHKPLAKLLSEIKQQDAQKIILYAPTFRRTKSLASITASATCGDSASCRNPRTPLSARAEMLVSPTEGTGVADAMIKAKSLSEPLSPLNFSKLNEFFVSSNRLAKSKYTLVG